MDTTDNTDITDIEYKENMENMEKPIILQNPKGTRDFGPNDVLIREMIIGKIKKHFERYGGVPIDTPVMEYMKTVENMYGEEFNKLVYTLDDYGGEKLLLRYDLTVPCARYVANNGLILFKRYQIGKVYRRDNPQIYRGRYREFYQCDFDIIGTDYNQMLQELEIINLLDDVINDLIGSNTYTIKINNKNLLQQILTKCGVNLCDINIVCNVLDKLDKLSKDELVVELTGKNIEQLVIQNIMNFINDIVHSDKTELENLYKNEFIDEQMFISMSNFFKQFNSPTIKFDPLLARGMDYYTGLIYEVVYYDKNVMPSSIAAGGRYDGVLEKFSSKGHIPAIGVSIGVERIVTILEHNSFIVNPPTPTIYVASVGNLSSMERIKLCIELRKQNLIVESSYLQNPKMRSQLDYVFYHNIPYMIVIGENEIKNNSVQIKDIKNKKQYTIQRNDIVSFLNSFN